MNYKILNNQEKKEIEKKLEEHYGIIKIPNEIIRTGKERIKLFTGDFTKKEIFDLKDITPIEGIGLYIAKEQNDLIRLSIDGTFLLGKQATKNILQLKNKKQIEEWMKGREILWEDIEEDSKKNKVTRKGFIILKFKDDFLGTGKSSEEKITNFIPKNRRLRERN